VTVSVGVIEGSHAVARTAVTAAIDSVLRDRKFAASLYESEISGQVRPLVDAGTVKFVNVRIDGSLVGGVVDTTRLDADGNLIIAASEVVTRGTVTVNVEAAPVG
jgi:hypothetical protein